MTPLSVTTSANAGADEVARARLLAGRFGVPYVRRRGAIDRLFEHSDVLYVVGKDKEELRSPAARLAMHEGMLRSRLHTGVDHPLIAALAPTGSADRVVDGTLGLAGDALHVAGALGCEVVGIEVQPELFSLVEEGLIRVGKSQHAVVAEAAQRVTPQLGDSAWVLAQMPTASADAVLLAPMYPNPDKAAPGFELLRGVAEHGEMTEQHVEHALRVAGRLVVKWPRGLDRPASLPTQSRCLSGHRVDYWICTQ